MDKIKSISTTVDLSKSTTLHRRSNIGLVQDVLLIWLDNSIDISSTDGQSTMGELRSFSDTIYTFSDRDQCADFLTDANNDKACMVISGTLCKNVIPLIHDVTQLQTIYILCRKNNRLEQWAGHWSKIQGIFTETTPVCKALKKAAYQFEHNAIPISIMGTDENISSKSLDQLNCSFMYTQIIKEILFTIKFEEKHMKDCFDYFRNELIDNEGTLNNVNKLEREYHDRTPIRWYTSEYFLYSLLNRALRTMQVDIVIKMGFFIDDLHRQIQQLHAAQFNTHHTDQSFTVYRGQGMFKTDFDQLMKTKGGLISFNNFLPTSKKRDVSLLFAESSLSDPNLVGILFVMTIDPSKSKTPFVSVNDVGYFGDIEEEVLFSIHTVFRIQNIQPTGENQRLFQVDLTLTTDDDKDLRILTDHIRKETFPESPGWYRLASVLLKMGHSRRAQQVYEAMLEQTTDDREKPPIYHAIVCAKSQQGKYKEAIKYYERSLEIERKTLLSNLPTMAKSYNTIGNVYRNLRNYSKALSYYEKSLAITQQLLPLNYLDLAHSYNNISNVYGQMGEYSIAISYYEKALAIREQSLPFNHPDLAASYNNIGMMYRNTGDHSKALSSYEQALAILRRSFPLNHSHLGATYNNIGNMCYNLGEYSKALSSFERALAILQQSLSPNHPHLSATYNNIGNVYDSMGEYSVAISSYEAALAIRQQSLPPNHPQLASCCNNIGTTYENMGDYSTARSFHERAVNIGQQLLPSNHPHLQLYRENLERILKKL